MTTVTYSYTPGWDADARTIASFSGNGSLTFSVGQAIGIVCGLNSANNSRNYFEIQHGFYITKNQYKIVESGIFKTSFNTFDSEAVFKIERINKVVKYYIDNVLVYTSLNYSDGIVFGDCSLFFYSDSIVDATITEIDELNEGESVLGFNSSGVEGDANYGAVGVGVIIAAGEEVEVNSAVIELGPIAAKGSSGDGNWGFSGLGPLSSSGIDDLLVPDYNAGSVTFGPIYSYGYEGQIDYTEAEVSLGPVWAAGAEGNPSWGNSELGPVYSFGYSLNKRYLYADWPAWTADIRSVVAPLYITGTASLEWPERVLTAEGESNNGTAKLLWPARNITAYGGGSAVLTWPVFALNVVGILEQIGTAELTWNEWVLTAEGLTGGVGEAELTWPIRSLNAHGGSSSVLTWPAWNLTVEGTLEIIGTSELTWPRKVLTATGLTGGIGIASLVWPARELVGTGLTGGVGTAELRWPTLVITALGSSAVAETTYAINLSTGAVTELLLGAFDKLVTAHGRVYGLKDGVLIYLGGSTDLGDEIPVKIRFAPQQFGTYQAKRLDGHVYLNTREDDGLTLTLIEDETISWTYSSDTDTAPAMGTHRIKVGRDITFHSLGVVVENKNGGKIDIGGMEITAYSLSRRPK